MTALLSTAFDYAALSDDVSAEAKAVAASIKERMRRMLGDYIDVGSDLIRIKDRLPHGEFGKWLKAEFGMTERTAQNYMNAAAFARECETVSYLKAKTLYLLAAPSTPQPVQQEVRDRLNSGERVEDKAVRKLVAEAKAQEREAQRAAQITAEEAALSPRTRRSRAAREAEEEQRRRDRAAATEAAKADARKAAELIVARLQPDDRKQLAALIRTNEDFDRRSESKNTLFEALIAAKDVTAPVAERSHDLAEFDSLAPVEPAPLVAPTPMAANAIPSPGDKGWHGKKPPVACNAKDSVCIYSKCAEIGCCQCSPRNAANAA